MCVISHPLETWYCDKCGYEITDAQYIAARFDYPCPRCKKSTLSKFHLRKRDGNMTDGIRRALDSVDADR